MHHARPQHLGNKRWLVLILGLLLIVGIIIGVGSMTVRAAGSEERVFQDKLANGWQDWSNTSVNLYNQNHARQGSTSLSATFKNRGEFVLLHSTNNLSGSNIDALSFWARGNLGGKPVRVMLADGNGNWGQPVDIYPSANAWQKFDIMLANLGSPAQISGIVFQNANAWSPPLFYLDDIRLVSWTQPTPQIDTSNTQVAAKSQSNGSNGSATKDGPQPVVRTAATQAQLTPSGNISVNINNPTHRISPYIYGINFAEEAIARELQLPLNRWGGNATTRYNYLLNTSNRAADWYFENIPGDNPGTLPNNSASDKFIQQNNRTGTASIMTMPMIGWTAKDRARRCGYGVSKYSGQDGSDPWFSECGTGTRGGQPITGNDPRDTSEPINEAFVQGWVRHLNRTFGTARDGGVQFYSLDNEPFLWNETHRDIRPNGAGYDEIRDLTYRYASAIKQVDPSAKTLGPVAWGWTAFEYSAKDAEAGDWDNPPDRLAHGDIPFVQWYLQQMAQYERNNGVRILDYLDLHFYPQSPGVGLSDAGSHQTQELRMRSTRLLWDRNYTEEYWIAKPTYLIPKMHDWVNRNYPGTGLALTEYNWGGLESMNGAVAQADVLGIFGRENLDLASLWAPGQQNEPWAYAFRMYRNYDGRGSQFGDQSLPTGSPNQGVYGVYAARRSSDGAVTVMVVNKSWSDATFNLGLQGLNGGGSAETYRYSSANLNAIQNLGQQQISGSSLNYNFPGQSITLFVIK